MWYLYTEKNILRKYIECAWLNYVLRLAEANKRVTLPPPVQSRARPRLSHRSSLTDSLQVCPPRCERARVFLTVFRERSLLKGLRIRVSF